MTLSINIDYSISKHAVIALGHLREHYSLTAFQAKGFYSIDCLPLIINELLAAGHLVHEVDCPRPGTTIRAYTLYEFKDNEPKVLRQLTKAKQRLFGRDPMPKNMELVINNEP